MKRIVLSNRERALLAEIIREVLPSGTQASTPGQRKQRRNMIRQEMHAIEDTINRRSFRSSLHRRGDAAPADEPALAEASD